MDSLLQLQDELQGQITYEEILVNGQPKEGRLRFTGAMTNIRRAKLEEVSTLQTYRDAVQRLYDAPRTFIARHMRTFSVPDFEEKLGGLPAGLQFPKALKGKIYFDTAADPQRSISSAP